MIYSSQLHPDEDSLSAFLAQPDSVHHGDVSLHLAECSACREQLSIMMHLKQSAPGLSQKSCTEQQQQLLEDYLYAELSEAKKESLRKEIKNDPLLLKQALLALSQQPFERKDNNPETQQSELKIIGFVSEIKKWWQSYSSNWSENWQVIPLTAVATLFIAVLVFQLTGLNIEQQGNIQLSSFQDNNEIRFVAKNTMPGIGFFSSAKQHSEAYENMLITVNNEGYLALAWQAVDNATEYKLKISRYSEGSKLLRKKITTQQTETTMKLIDADFNQRFEWILSGNTSDNKAFIASGGFVMNRTDK